MLDSADVLGLMKLVYSLYTVLVLSLFGLLLYKFRRPGKTSLPVNALFYGWVACLIGSGVGIHILTFHKIPWVKWDKGGTTISVDREFDIGIRGQEFLMPQEKLVIAKDDMVRFNLTSHDYTYGFGLFREDGTLVFQMQVTPGRQNSIVWKFPKPETYTIRSTEYSGPRGGDLVVRNAVVVGQESKVALSAGQARGRDDS